MAIVEGSDLSWVMDLPETPDELLSEHLLDVSAIVWSRMRELGLTKSALARRLGWKKGRVRKVIRGERDLTLAELAELECALGFRIHVPAPPRDAKCHAVAPCDL